MQQWEYLAVSTHDLGNGVAFNDGTERWWDDRSTMLKEVGDEGWELVHAEQDEFGETVYTFKRPKP